MNYLIKIESDISGDYRYIIANSQNELRNVIGILDASHSLINVTPMDGTVYTSSAYISELED